MSLSSEIKAWIEIQELYKHPATIFPFLLGTSVAFTVNRHINWAVFLVSLFGLYCITNMCYISNEYYDYETDRRNFERIGGAEKVSVTTTGGTRVLVKGLIPRKNALYISIIFFILAFIIAIVLQYSFNTGILTIPFVLAGGFLGWFYTSPPIKACYRALGELFLAVMVFLLVIAGYYLQSGKIGLLPVIAALPYATASFALKIIREYPDYEADFETNKRNLVVIFGKSAMVPVYIALILVSLILLIPIIWLVRSFTTILLIIPIGFLGIGIPYMICGKWKNPKDLEFIAKNGFIGLLLIPLLLTIIFLIQGIFG